jgi:SAM-dependent methyltransferase
MDAQLTEALHRGSSEHYADATQYDHEYRGRREDVAFYLAVAQRHAQGAILELGCGSGRLTLPLMRAGHTVVGVDAAAPMVKALAERVRRVQGNAAARLSLHVADFRELAGKRSPLGTQRFSLIVCPFNAFQHLYERQDVEQFLTGVREHLLPRGRLVFDLMNPDLRWLSRDSRRRWGRTRYKDPHTGRPMIYSHELVYDAPLQIAFMTIYYERADGQRRGSHRNLLTHRYFFPRELEALLHYNGFQVDRRDGDFAGEALTADSEQQVWWCRIAAPRSRRKKPR